MSRGEGRSLGDTLSKMPNAVIEQANNKGNLDAQMDVYKCERYDSK